MSIFNICDVPLDINTKYEIIRGVFTMFIMFTFGFVMGKLLKKEEVRR
jgi:hypothetical protein